MLLSRKYPPRPFVGDVTATREVRASVTYVTPIKVSTRVKDLDLVITTFHSLTSCTFNSKINAASNTLPIHCFCALIVPDAT
jgi:hypothetical protein